MSFCSHKFKLNIGVCACVCETQRDENTRLCKTIRKSAFHHLSHIFSLSQPLFDGFRWSTFFPWTVVLPANQTRVQCSHLHNSDSILPFSSWETRAQYYIISKCVSYRFCQWIVDVFLSTYVYVESTKGIPNCFCWIFSQSLCLWSNF